MENSMNSDETIYVQCSFFLEIVRFSCLSLVFQNAPPILIYAGPRWEFQDGDPAKSLSKATLFPPGAIKAGGYSSWRQRGSSATAQLPQSQVPLPHAHVHVKTDIERKCSPETDAPPHVCWSAGFLYQWHLSAKHAQGLLWILYCIRLSISIPGHYSLAYHHSPFKVFLYHNVVAIVATLSQWRIDLEGSCRQATWNQADRALSYMNVWYNARIGLIAIRNMSSSILS